VASHAQRATVAGAYGKPRSRPPPLRPVSPLLPHQMGNVGSAGTAARSRARVPVQMWEGWAESRCRCGRGGPSPGADVGGVGPVPVQMWEGALRHADLSIPSTLIRQTHHTLTEPPLSAPGGGCRHRSPECQAKPGPIGGLIRSGKLAV
jgi:hypothetical protein